MQIQAVQQNHNIPAFTSRNNPVPVEKFITALGNITISETTAKDDIIAVSKLIRARETNSFKLLNFYNKNATEAKEIYKNINRNQWLKDIKEYITNMLKKNDGNSTLVVAKNDKNKVVGFATMQSLDNVNAKIGIIEHIYLDFQHQKEDNLGLYLLNKITQSAKGQFDHVVTQSPAIGPWDVYYDLGYRAISENTPIVKILEQKTNNRHWMVKKVNYLG